MVVDLVPNHTSDRHPWFQAALAAGPGSPERERYIFRPGSGPDGSEPPNDWRSVFGGPAWTRVLEPDGRPGQWYLHLFAPEQPDLNWRHPQVRAEFESILRFWLDRGVDGFRIDVAHGLVKDPALPDVGPDQHRPAVLDSAESRVVPYGDQDEVHEVYRSWRTVCAAYGEDRVLVGEAWVDASERLARYVRHDELHQTFNFGFLKAPWSASALRAVIDRSLHANGTVGAPTTWVLSNHDVTRHPTRYGGGERGLRRARAAALLMLALPGSAYLYQGEELGLPEVTDLPDEVLQDPVWTRSGYAERGRDGCRVPIPWRGERPPFGFGPDGSGRSWLPVPAGWRELTVDAQAATPDSTLALYRAALRLRRVHPALGDGTLRWLDSPAEILLFRRDPGFACAVNLGDRPVTLPLAGTVLLASTSAVRVAGRSLTLPPDAAAWVQV